MSASEEKQAYESAGVDRPGLIAAGVVLSIVAIALCMVGLYFFYLPAAREGPITLKAFDEPRLQTNPQGDLHDLIERQTGTLEKTEWRDREAGTLRIPIEAAIRMVARRGPDAFAPLPNAPRADANPGERPADAMAPADRRANPGGGSSNQTGEDR